MIVVGQRLVSSIRGRVPNATNPRWRTSERNRSSRRRWLVQPVVRLQRRPAAADGFVLLVAPETYASASVGQALAPESMLQYPPLRVIRNGYG